jgi:hypothetical protein
VEVSYLYGMDSSKNRVSGRRANLPAGGAGWPSARTIYGAIVFLTLIGIAIVALRASKLAPFLFLGQHVDFLGQHVDFLGQHVDFLGRHADPSSPASSAFARTDMIFERFPVLTMVHIFVALVFILTGPFQVIHPLCANYPSVQRKTKPIFWVSGFIMGVTAVVMSFVMPSIGGVNQAASTILFGAFFLFALCRAVVNDRSGNSVLRREWLVRAYAIALAVTSIRLVVGIFFATSRLSGLKPEEFFGIAFWIGFVIHLILAEAWIHRTRVAG